MTWTKIDDQLHAHPKVQQAWQTSRAAIGLHLLALSHASAYLTDGHVSDAFVTAQLPSAAERRKAVGALVDSGLWDDSEAGGWTIHDFLEFNESRTQVESRRRSDSRRKRRGSEGES